MTVSTRVLDRFLNFKKEKTFCLFFSFILLFQVCSISLGAEGIAPPLTKTAISQEIKKQEINYNENLLKEEKSLQPTKKNIEFNKNTVFKILRILFGILLLIFAFIQIIKVLKTKNVLKKNFQEPKFKQEEGTIAVSKAVSSFIRHRLKFKL
ncbi:MAG: hypothetical protein V2B14_03210 [bacterium]